MGEGQFGAPLPFFIMNPGPSIPDMRMLSTQAPMHAWLQVLKQARRSPMIRYKVGCVIWDPSKEQIIAKGCSHPDIKLSKVLASIHAERHAVSNAFGRSLEGGWALVYTTTSRGGCSYTSRPCYSCARSLYNADVERVVYPERNRSGTWTVVSEHPEALLDRAPAPEGLYAREQRIPALV